MKYEKQLTAVKELRDYDHCFLSPEGVKYFAKSFGVKLKPYRLSANPHEPKGLTLYSGKSSALGMDATEMARSVCKQLNVPYESKFGRGSQLKECCEKLQEHFTTIIPGVK